MTSGSIALAAIILWSGTAQAVENCTNVRVAMTRFHPAEFSAPLIWQASAGEKTIENFADALMLEDQSVIAGGYFAPADKPDVTQPYLMRMERRGKILWQVRGDAKAAQKIVRIEKDGDEIVVLSKSDAHDQVPARIEVIRYDFDGKRLNAFAISEGDGLLEPVALAVVSDGYYIAARYANRKVKDQRFGVLYKLNKDGSRQWRRAYTPGLTTSLGNMIVLGNGDVLMVGTLTSRDGLTSGWIVRTDKDGGLKWQKSYPRGKASELLSVDETPDGYIVGGVAWPLEGERTGAWVMKVDTGGDMRWERFYRGADDYSAVDVDALNDGRLVALIGAVPTKAVMASEGEYPHARLTVLSPIGELLEADSFAAGNGLWPARLMDADRQPLIIGTAKEIPPDPPADKKPPPPPPPVSYDGWIGELQTFAAYDNPCVK